MGSYLAQALDHRITKTKALALSLGWIKRKFGAVVSDGDVDAAVAKIDAATDKLVPVIADLLNDAIPGTAFEDTRKVIATQIATAVLNQVDTAVSAAGAFVKANN